MKHTLEEQVVSLVPEKKRKRRVDALSEPAFKYFGVLPRVTKSLSVSSICESRKICPFRTSEHLGWERCPLH